MNYLQPLTPVFLMIALIGLVRMRHSKEFLVTMIGIAGLVLVSWPPVDWLLSRPLEAWYPLRPPPLKPLSAQAIVVLSSAVSPPLFERPYALPDKDTYQRCEFAAWLYQQWHRLPLLACGGPGSKGEQPVSSIMKQMLQRAAVPENMIWTEERSANTHESAVYGADILREHGIARIILVVEAQNMLRAELSFRKQGISVVPAPCAFRQFERSIEELIPSWRAISRNEGTAHEMLGLVWYWLHGWV